MALFNLFRSFVTFLIDMNNFNVFLSELTLLVFSCFNVPFFSPAWTYQIPFASLLFAPVFRMI